MTATNALTDPASMLADHLTRTIAPAPQTVRLEAIVGALINELDPTPERGALRETPRRVARFYHEFLSHLRHPLAPPGGSLDTCFLPDDERDPAGTADQLVTATGIRVWSLCEHHLLPFWTDLAIGYLPHGRKVLGYSKFARISQHHAGALTMQERLVARIHEHVSAATDSPDVAVYGVGAHLCAVMRGPRQAHGLLHSEKLSGVFLSSPSAKAEFLTLATAGGPK